MTLSPASAREERAFRTPAGDPNWEISTEVQFNQDAEIVWFLPPIKVSKGTKLLATAHYDNFANNRFNPNPNKDVWWGDQTWEEMMAQFGVLVDKSADPRKVVTYTPKYSGAVVRGEFR